MFVKRTMKDERDSDQDAKELAATRHGPPQPQPHHPARLLLQQPCFSISVHATMMPTGTRGWSDSPPLMTLLGELWANNKKLHLRMLVLWSISGPFWPFLTYATQGSFGRESRFQLLFFTSSRELGGNVFGTSHWFQLLQKTNDDHRDLCGTSILRSLVNIGVVIAKLWAWQRRAAWARVSSRSVPRTNPWCFPAPFCSIIGRPPLNEKHARPNGVINVSTPWLIRLTIIIKFE